MITKEEFEELSGKKLIEEDGKLVYKDNLDLNTRTEITELPDNLKVLGYLNLCYSSITKLPKGLEVENWLEISGTNIEELPEDTKFGGSLYVRHMKKPFSFPRVVRVYKGFECKDTTIKRIPKELYVNYHCDLSYSKFDELPKVMEVGSCLYLNNTPTTKLPEGLKNVYGDLNLRDTNVTKLNDNLVIHRTFNFVRTPIEELPKGLIVGYWLNLCNTKLRDYSNLHKVCSRFGVTEEKYNEIKDTLAEHTISIVKRFSTVLVTFEPNYKGAYLFENENGKFIDADDMFAKIIKQKGNVYHIQMDGSGEISYLITNGEGRWAHGDTLEEAKDDLLFKIGNRNKDDYEGLTMDSELSFQDAITCYRVITGACSFGTRDFVENRLGENRKDKYTVKEIIDLTEGEYGNKVFSEFFYRD